MPRCGERRQATVDICSPLPRNISTTWDRTPQNGVLYTLNSNYLTRGYRNIGLSKHKKKSQGLENPLLLPSQPVKKQLNANLNSNTMRRVTVIKETWSNVMNSQRREDIGKWCQENAVSGYQTIKTLVKTLLGKLRLILDASVLRHALANSEYLRLFGVSLVFAIGTSWMVGGAVQMVNNKRRKNRQSTNTGGAMARKKQTNSSKKINLPVNKVRLQCI